MRHRQENSTRRSFGCDQRATEKFMPKTHYRKAAKYAYPRQFTRLRLEQAWRYNSLEDQWILVRDSSVTNIFTIRVPL